jgi:hypothetical protein
MAMRFLKKQAAIAVKYWHEKHIMQLHPNLIYIQSKSVALDTPD